jgi:acylphosphatase
MSNPLHRHAQLEDIRMDVIVRVIISGRVQGVGFRAWTEVTAARCSLEGWVRNRRDGSVEALFAGSQYDVDAMLALCRVGPRGARVDSVDQREGAREELTLRRRGELFSVLATV